MKLSAESFTYADECGKAPDEILEVIPPGIDEEGELFAAYGHALNFPTCSSWTAFRDRLCDLAWIPAGLVTVFHSDIPLDGQAESVARLVEALRDAVRVSTPTRLSVVFPVSKRRQIREILFELDGP